MGHLNLAAAVADLERSGQLVRIEEEIDPHLEAAEIHRRVYAVRGPALFFARVKGTPFPMVSNLFGTLERAKYLFRDSLDDVRKLVELKTDPANLRKQPWRTGKFLLDVAITAKVRAFGSGASPHDHCFATSAVEVLAARRRGVRDTAAGLHRASGHTRLGEVESRDVPRATEAAMNTSRIAKWSLHYQIHRGIGAHHAAAVRRGERLRVNVIVGGPPALAVAAVMPLPEGLPELAFRTSRWGKATEPRSTLTPPPPRGRGGRPSASDPPLPCREGVGGGALPFPGRGRLRHFWLDRPGSHEARRAVRRPPRLLQPHARIPCQLTVDAVYHRPNAIWPFTVVGRPPQEDTTFGELIHETHRPGQFRR